MEMYRSSLHEFKLRSLVAAKIALLAPTASLAQVITLEFETRIETTDSFPGMKSRQTVSFDPSSPGSETSDFETGSTDFGHFEIDATRSEFEIGNVDFSGGEVQFDVTGQTASGVMVLPDIDYKFRVRYSKSDNQISLSGCHDAYPSYKVSVNGRQFYYARHKPASNITDVVDLLIGECDILVSASTEP